MSSSHALLTDFETREIVLRADFDLLDEGRWVWVSLRFIHDLRAPEEDDLVYLLDSLGRGCVGTVESVEGHYARVRPDWSTFTGGPLPSGAA